MLPLYLNKKHFPGNREKSWQRWLRLTGMILLAIYLLPSAAQAQPNITRIEYYLDVDPGFGNATTLSITPSADIQNAVISIDPATLAMGVHRLFVRARDANGSWSLTNTWLFYKPYPVPAAPPAPLPPANLRKLEYYIDTDPGNGLAVPVAIQHITDLSDLLVSINVTGLATGDHQLQVRSQDSSGAWSMVNSLPFTIPAALAIPAIVVNSVSRTTLCARDSFTIGYHITGTYNSGNTFTAFLSDASSSFTGEQVVGSVTAGSDGLISCKLPNHLPDGSGYKLRVKSSNTALTGAASTLTFTIHDRPFAQTISGLASVNGNETWPYSLPNATNSTWNWMIINGVKTTGGSTNTGNIAWAAGNANAIKAAQILVIETNQYGCIGDTSTKPVNIYKLRIGNTLSTVTPCPKDSVTITINTDGVFYTSPAANQFVAELSNGTGDFTTPAATANIISAAITGIGQAAGILKIGLPGNLPNSTNYRIRVRSTNPAFIGDTSVAISVLKPALGADLNRSYCIGRGYNLTQNFTDNSLTYTYYTASFAALTRSDSVEAGTYQVIGSNVQGCRDTASVTLTGNPSPSLGADTTIFHDCPGETSNLNLLYSTTGLTASWNTVNTTAAPPGTYRLVITNNFSCTDTAFAIIKLETALWLGTISSNWHTPGNWNINKVPTDKTHVIITGATPFPCIISTANAQAASIQVRNGGTVQTANSKTADVKGKCVTLPAN